VVNGEARPLSDAATVADLLSDLRLDPEQVAVERNLDIVPRNRYGETTLAAGDVLEIVTFVGGG